MTTETAAIGTEKQKKMFETLNRSYSELSDAVKEQQYEKSAEDNNEFIEECTTPQEENTLVQMLESARQEYSDELWYAAAAEHYKPAVNMNIFSELERILKNHTHKITNSASQETDKELKAEIEYLKTEIGEFKKKAESIQNIKFIPGFLKKYTVNRTKKNYLSKFENNASYRSAVSEMRNCKDEKYKCRLLESHAYYLKEMIKEIMVAKETKSLISDIEQNGFSEQISKKEYYNLIAQYPASIEKIKELKNVINTTTGLIKEQDAKVRIHKLAAEHNDKTAQLYETAKYIVLTYQPKTAQ
jgi:hypothetical protein